MNRRDLAVLAALAASSAVYLLYLPHALPVLDDWMWLEALHKARTGGFAVEIAFFQHIIDNTWLGQFRIFWTGLLPYFVFALAAGFSGWPYFLLAWAAHLLTGLLLFRIVSLLSGDGEIAFTAAAVYVVFPAANGALFWPLTVYYLETLAFAAWFYYTWSKLAVRGDYRYRFTDFALLLAAVFSGEQILPALLLLLPLTFWLAGERRQRRPFARFWLIHAGAMAVLLASYTLAINRESILQSFGKRYETVHPWSLRGPSYMLFSSLGLNQDFARRLPGWWRDPALLALAALAALAFFGTLRRRPASRSGARFPELLLWSIAGVILTYLPTARLNTFEWRYFYALSFFLVPAGVAVLAALPRPARLFASFVTLAWCLTQTYFALTQCWIPQSREARAILDAVAAAGPFQSHEAFVFSGDHLVNGFAPSFINGSSWSMQAALERATGADHVRGARDLVINEHGELALHCRDEFLWFHRQDLARLRVFVRRPDNRFVAKSILALPAPDGRFEVVPLRSYSGLPLPSSPLTLDELKRLAQFPDVYFARRISSHYKPTDL